MEEGKVIISEEYKGSPRFRVDATCFSGKMECVGVVWPTGAYSVEAKRTGRREWWAQRAGLSGATGPFKSRKAAAAYLAT